LDIRKKWQEAGEDCIMRSFITLQQTIIRVIKSRRMRRAGHGACMGEVRNAYKILVGKPQEKRPFEDLDNIRMNPRRIGWDSVDWIHLAQNRDQW
jgi:hypothetical protein